MVHGGGWSPVAGPLACTFRTPAFSGSVTLGPGTKIALDASLDWQGALTIVADLLILRQPHLSLTLNAHVESDTFDLVATFSAGLQLGPASATVPQLSVSGRLASYGVSYLHLATSEQYQLTPQLRIPALAGSLHFSPDGAANATVSHAPLPSISLAGDLLTLESFTSAISATLPGAAAPRQRFRRLDVECADDSRRRLNGAHAQFRAEVSGRVVVGGPEPEGFAADIQGSVDTATQTLNVELGHTGGWSPLPSESAIAELLTTPAFTGALQVDGDQSVDLSASVHWQQSLDLVPGVIRLDSPMHSSHPGPVLHLQLTRPASSADAVWKVHLLCGLQLGPNSLGLPMFSSAGTIASSGVSVLQVAMPSTWVLLPGQLDMVMPGLSGNLTLGTAQGGHRRRLDSLAPSAQRVDLGTGEGGDLVLLDGKLQLLGWRATITYSPPATPLTLSANGHIRIGADSDTDGFTGSVVAQIDFDNSSASLAVAHGGGYRPFSSLPSFVTPAMQATLDLNRDGKFVHLTCEVDVPAAIDLFGVISLAGTGPLPGPRFGLQLEQGAKGEAVAFGGFFLGGICVKLDSHNRCMHVRATASAERFSLEATWTDGDLRPLMGLGLPSASEHAVIQGTEEAPLTVNLEASQAWGGQESSLSFRLSGTMTVDLVGVGGSIYQLHFAAQGRFASSRASGVFVASLPNAPAFEGAGGRLTGLQGALMLSLATSADLPAVTVGDAVIVAPPGVAILYRGPSPLPELCPGVLSASFGLESVDRMAFAAACPMDASFNLSSVPGLNLIKFEAISVQAQIEPGVITFSAGAAFLLATGNSTCKDPLTDASCLTATVALDVTIGTGLAIRFAFEGQGTWLEPFGLFNFALGDPCFSVGLELGAAVVLNELAWGLSIYWKRSRATEWPAALFTKVTPYVQPSVDASDFLTLSSHFLFELAPHSAAATLGGLPRFACKLAVTEMQLVDVLYMVHDLTRSLVKHATQRDIGAVRLSACLRATPHQCRSRFCPVSMR